MAVSAVTINAALLTIDTTTGQVTFAANISGTITAITKAAQAVITIGAHSLTTNHSVHISGVSGMTEINGQRANIVATGAKRSPWRSTPAATAPIPVAARSTPGRRARAGHRRL